MFKLKNSRITLKLLSQKHVNLFIDLCLSGGIAENNFGQYDNMDFTKASDWIEKQREEFKMTGEAKFGVFLNEGMELIGVCGIFNSKNRLEDRREINFRLHHDYRRKGYAYDAARLVIKYGLNVLNLKELYATVITENIPSKNLLNKLGFKYTDICAVGEKTLETYVVADIPISE